MLDMGDKLQLRGRLPGKFMTSKTVAAATAGDVRPGPIAETDRLVFAFFAVQVVGLTVLQKISVPLSPVPFTTALFLPGVVTLFLLGSAKINATKAVLYAATLMIALLSQFATAQPFSAGSLGLLVWLYAPLIFQIDVSQATFRKCFAFYLNVMSVAAVILLAENVWQFLISPGPLPNLEKFVPASLLVKDYVYIQPIEYGSIYTKPNAFFFLEVSYLSQFLAIALVAELVIFQRLWRLLLYGIAILGSFGGTGALTLLLVSPLLALRAPPRILAVGAVGLAIAIPLILFSGWLDYAVSRLDEFGSQTSSGYARFVAPILLMTQAATESAFTYTGIGAGNTLKSLNTLWWPVTKMFVEYGLLATACLYVMLIYALFSRAPSAALALTTFVIYNFMGGNLLMPVIVNLMLLISALIRPMNDDPGTQDGSKVRQRSTPFVAAD